MIRRILVALDGSQLAEQALPAASGLAVATGAEILLMTAISPMERWVDDKTLRPWEEEETALASGYLDSRARPLRENGLQVKTHVVWGRAATMISETADQENSDLIVMTTHGRSGIARWLIGSVADKVLRAAERPLLLLRSHDGASRPLNVRRILLPLDGSRLAESALPFVKELAKQMSASVILERVVVPPTFLYPEQYVPGTFPLLEDMESEAKAYLDAVKAPIEADEITVTTNIDDGFPTEAIVDAARHFEADVVALTTHGRTGPGRTILGSVADGVVRHADRPCLVIPARATAALTREEELRAPATLGIEPPPTVIPPPAMSEVAAEKAPRVKAPAARPHRPEGGRKI